MSADVASGIERRLASTRNGVLAQLQACRDAGLHDELDGVLRDDIRIIESQVEVCFFWFYLMFALAELTG